MAPPAPLACSVQACAYVTPDNTPTWEGIIQLMSLHTTAVHTSAPGTAPKLEKLPRPTFSLNMTESKWNFLVIQWKNYIGQSPNAEEATKLMQLQAACDDDLRQRVYDTGNFATLNTTALFLAKMKELAVITVHKSVHLMNLWRMLQETDETIRAFVARVTATADMCGMSVPCLQCNRNLSYRDQVVQQIIIHGMRDNDVRIRVLSRNTAGELDTLEKLVDYIAAEEAGISESHNLNNQNTVGALRRSSYRKSQSQTPSGPCRNCGQKHPSDRKKYCKAYGTECSKCTKLGHFAKLCESSPKNAAASAELPEDSSVASISSLWDTTSTHYPTSSADLQCPVNTMRGWDQGPVTHVPLPHHVHDKVRGWLSSRPLNSPTLKVTLSLDRPAYSSLGLNIPRFRNSSHNPGRTASKSAVPDTGAQLTVIPLTVLEDMNIKLDSIFPVSTRLNGVSNAPVMIEGGVLLNITASNPKTGVSKTSKQLCYVSRHVAVTYLSHEVCLDLGLIPASFPEIGSCDRSPTASIHSLTSPSPTKCSNTGVPASRDDVQCPCPRREPPPESPPVLPCAPTPENIPRLKQYIMDRFKSSAFNCCEHQPLRLMENSPPLRLFVEEGARPVAVHTPSQVPLHWQEQSRIAWTVTSVWVSSRRSLLMTQ